MGAIATFVIGDQLTGGHATEAASNALGTKKPAPSGVLATPAIKPGMTQAEIDRLAQNAAAKRKSDYQNTGRSSTILTSPLGLPGVGQGASKTLLGT